LLRETLERTGIVSWELSPDTGAFRTSANFDLIHGLPDGVTCGRWDDLLALVHHDDRANLERAVEEAGSGAENVETEIRVGAPEAQRWIYARLSSIADTDGGVRVLGLARDVTLRHEAEQRERFLADATNALGAATGYEDTL